MGARVLRKQDAGARGVPEQLGPTAGRVNTERLAALALPNSDAPVRWAWAALVLKVSPEALIALPEALALLSLPDDSLPAPEWLAWEQSAKVSREWRSSGLGQKGCRAPAVAGWLRR